MTGSSDLLADLRVDRGRATGPAAPPVHEPPVPEPPAELPAFELRVTPLHWALPRLARSGSGLIAAAGPVHAAVRWA